MFRAAQAAGAVLVLATAACGSPERLREPIGERPSVPVWAEADLTAIAPMTVDLVVTSGRPQPPARVHVARVGQPIAVRVRGLGPPKVTVRGPDGAIVATAASPVRDGAALVGVEYAFVPATAGEYRVEHADAGDALLATIRATD